MYTWASSPFTPPIPSRRYPLIFRKKVKKKSFHSIQTHLPTQTRVIDETRSESQTMSIGNKSKKTLDTMPDPLDIGDST